MTWRDRRILAVTHLYSGSRWEAGARLPELQTACGQAIAYKMGHRPPYVLDDIDGVTCGACREKYFGLAGIDPHKLYNPTTD